MKFVFYANTDWYLFNFRLSTALELKAHGHDVVMLSPPGEFGAPQCGLRGNVVRDLTVRHVERAQERAQRLTWFEGGAGLGVSVEIDVELAVGVGGFQSMTGANRQCSFAHTRHAVYCDSTSSAHDGVHLQVAPDENEGCSRQEVAPVL